MSTLVGGTGIIGQDIFCSFGNGKYTTFEGTEIVAENCVKARVKDLVVEGRTYHNLTDKVTLYRGTVNHDNNMSTIRVSSNDFSLPIGTYTILVTDSTFQIAVYHHYETTNSTFISWTNKIIWHNDSETNNPKFTVRKKDQSKITVDEVIGKVILLEGDYTNTDLPTSIDGIESVAEREGNVLSIVNKGKNLINTIIKNKSWDITTSNLKDNLGAFCTEKIKVKKNTTYVYSLNGSINNIGILCFNSEKKHVSNKYDSRITVTDGIEYLALQGRDPDIGKGGEMLEEGTVTTSYEPYREPIITNINMPIPLRSLPNGVADTIEGDKLVQRVGKIVIDGTQSFILNNVNQTKTTRGYFTLDNAKISNKNNLICNWYIRTGAHGDYEYIIIQKIVEETLNTVFISVLNSKLKTTDVNGLKKYFKENPLPVYYELAEPIIHDLTVPQLSTAKGTNIITTSNNIKPKISMKVKVK